MFLFDSDLCLSIVSIVVAFVSAVFSFIALWQTIKQRRKDIQDYLYTNISSIGVFIFDACKILSDEKFSDTSDIQKAEKDLMNGFNRLYSYGKTNRLNNLCEFSTIYAGSIKENLRCFAYVFFLFEAKYLQFREKRVGTTLSNNDKIYLQDSVTALRSLLELASEYTLNFLFSKKPRNKVRKSYYARLKERYKIKEKRYA